MSETEVDSKLSVIQKMWQRFLYRDAILLEAQRQKEQFNKTSEWANAFATLIDDDDAFSTLIEVSSATFAVSYILSVLMLLCPDSSKCGGCKNVFEYERIS
mgnify:CR=1 FL=1